jgi:hypothetical protein
MKSTLSGLSSGLDLTQRYLRVLLHPTEHAIERCLPKGLVAFRKPVVGSDGATVCNIGPPLFRKFVRLRDSPAWRLTSVYLGSWGARTCKPLKIMTSCEALRGIETNSPHKEAKLVKVRIRDGKRLITGDLKQLKELRGTVFVCCRAIV